MKGNLWTVAVVLVFLALLLPAVSIGYDDATADDGEQSDPQETTEAIGDILATFDGWIAVLFLFVVVAAIVAMSFGGSSFGGR